MEKLQLKELVDIYLGVTHTPKYVYAGVPFLSVKDISGGQINFDNCKYISEEEYNSLSQGAKPQVGDMLFCRVGTIGKPIIIPKGTPRFGSFVSLGYLRNKDNSRCRMDYLKHWMNSKSFYDQVQSNVKGASQVNLNTGWLSKFEVRLPDYRAQSDIVATLDLCERIINNRNLELQKLDNLIKARFVEMFGDPITNPKGWEHITVGDVCSSIVRGPFGSALKKEFFVEPSDNTYKVYEQKHAIQKSADIGTYYITAEKFAELKRFECLPGDILMSCSGTMGELFQLPDGCERGIINQALCKFTLNERILPICFLTYMRQTIGNLETKGSGIQNIAAVSYVKAMPINLPTMDVQEKFADFVKQIDKSKVVVPSKIKMRYLL